MMRLSRRFLFRALAVAPVAAMAPRPFATGCIVSPLNADKWLSVYGPESLIPLSQLRRSSTSPTEVHIRMVR